MFKDYLEICLEVKLITQLKSDSYYMTDMSFDVDLCYRSGCEPQTCCHGFQSRLECWLHRGSGEQYDVNIIELQQGVLWNREFSHKTAKFMPYKRNLFFMLTQIYFHVNAKHYIKNRKLKFYIVGQTKYATRCM